MMGRAARPRTRIVAPALMLAAVLIAPCLARAGEPTRAAAALYKRERYDDAAKRLERAMERHPDDPLLQYDLGTVRYRQRHYEEAAQSLNHALAQAGSPLQGRISYNLGNTHYRQAQAKASSAAQEAATLYRQALEDYKTAIRNDPRDRDAQYNYELTQRRMQQLNATQQQAKQQGDQSQRQREKRQPAGGQEKQDGASSQSQAGQAQQQAATPSTSTPPDQQGSASHAPSSQQSDQQQTGASQASSAQGDGKTEQPATTADQQASGGTQSSSANDGHEISKQQALWILDALRREERGMPQGASQAPARERAVEQDW